MASTRRRSPQPAPSKPARRPAKDAARRRTHKPAAAARPEHDAIALRAYAIFEAEGGGDRVEHWLRAERELTRS